MIIQMPQAVQDQKSLLLLMILDILTEETDPGTHMTKEKLRARIEEKFGFLPARNTLYDKLDIMTLAGIPIMQADDGLYYDGDSLTDGELRYLVDSVLYSDFVTPKGAESIIESLAKLGSPIFRKYVESQTARIRHTRKSRQQGIFNTIEDVQNAIFRRRQIRFNELTYGRDLKPRRRHKNALTVNPYEMVCKNGRYYLIGAQDGADTMQTWRVDRLCDLEILEALCVEIRQYRDVLASGGMSVYTDAQPELCGGKIETFTLQVSDMAIDDIVDVFGTDFRVLTDRKAEPDVLFLKVRATRESVRTWAMIHAPSVIILTPEDLHYEIRRKLYLANMLYTERRQSVLWRARFADSLEETVRLIRLSGSTELTYHSYRMLKGYEQIDSAVFEGVENIEWLRLSGCAVPDPAFLLRFPKLRILHIDRCEFDVNALRNVPNLEELSISICVPALTEILAEMKHLKTLRFYLCRMQELSVLESSMNLESLQLDFCNRITDFSGIRALHKLKKLFVHGSIRQADFSFLPEMKSLREVEIHLPCFGYKAAKALQEKMPQCRIIVRGFNEDEFDEDTE